MKDMHTNPFGYLGKAGVNALSEASNISLNAIPGNTMTGVFSNICKNMAFFFSVTNTYVLQKARLILMPFLEKGEWKQDLNEEGLPLPPKENLHSPDLYIPLMTFITFILLAGISSGHRGDFSPEYMGLAASSGLIMMCLEMLLVYTGLYFMQASLPGVFELVSFSGYKFLVCVLNQVFMMGLGVDFYYLPFCYGTVMYSMFLVFFI